MTMMISMTMTVMEIMSTTMNKNHRPSIYRALRRIGAAVLAAMLAVAPALPTFAAAGQTGRIVIQVPEGYNGTFRAYQVADFVPETETLTVVEPFKSGYTGTPKITMGNIRFDDEPANKEDKTFRQLVESVRSYYKGMDDNAKAQLSEVSGSPFSTTLESVPFGLYLIVQAQKGSGYKEMEPFLLILPQRTGATATGVTVTVEAKLETEPSGPPDEPPDNPPDNPPTTPPTNPPTTPNEIVEIGDEGDSGIVEIGSIEEGGSLTGDNSPIVIYGVVAAAAAAGLIVWFVRRRKDKDAS